MHRGTYRKRQSANNAQIRLSLNRRVLAKATADAAAGGSAISPTLADVTYFECALHITVLCMRGRHCQPPSSPPAASPPRACLPC